MRLNDQPGTQHSARQLQFTPIPILSSNYVWLIENRAVNQAYIVDPGSSKEVLDALSKYNLMPKGILVTHSHNDHIGGIRDILQHYDIPVYGPKCGAIPMVSDALDEGSSLELWPSVPCSVMHLPGHLPEHIVYLVADLKSDHLFSGDVLFSSGCGRMFVGTAQEFQQSLTRLARLHGHTYVYCAHEYTIDNLRFAKHVEPNNSDIDAKIAETQKRLVQKKCSLPSTIDSELKTNPFMRTSNTLLRTRVAAICDYAISNDEETFAALRSLKDSF